MSKIAILSEELQNQIAAGEVVERPASVVKELIENSLDAGATTIQIDLKKAGKEEIIITDNGEGMSKEDALKALKRYATSKIASQEDLWNLHTFGFRGEALASISAVSDFTLETKQASDQHGVCISTSGESGAPKVESIGCPTGTKVVVRDLFERVPARLKFLKADTTELHAVLNTIEQTVLIHPDREWIVTHNGKNIHHLTAIDSDWNESLAIQAKRILSVKDKQDLYPLNTESATIEIKGCIGAPTLARRNRKHQYFFVNQRPIKNSTLSAAVMAGFQSVLPDRSYPLCVIDITITSDLVDMNVHPRKQEVRFIQSQQVFLAVKAAVEKAIKGMNHINRAETTPPVTTTPYQSAVSPQKPQNSFQYNTSSSYQPTPLRFHYNNPTAPQPRKTEATANALEFSKNILQPMQAVATDPISQTESTAQESEEIIVGQIHNAYIVVEQPEGILILDQHAVHERIRYEMLHKAAANNQAVGQKLLIAEEIQLSASEMTFFSMQKEFFESLGFEFFDQNDNTICISAIPVSIDEHNISQIFTGMLDHLMNTVDIQSPIEAIHERAILYLSCRKATKFGDKLDRQELQYLYDEWKKCDKKETCPHGRALSYLVPYNELNKHFDRT